MTSRERIKRALRHEEPDRVPVTDGLWHATITRWKKEGGYIYHSDHSVPKNVSFQQYKRVMELVRKYGQY